MTVFIKEAPTHKVVVIGWNQAAGLTVDVEVTHADGTLEYVKGLANKGQANLYFPVDYAGSCTVAVQGSKPGSAADTGTLSIA